MLMLNTPQMTLVRGVTEKTCSFTEHVEGSFSKHVLIMIMKVCLLLINLCNPMFSYVIKRGE